VVVIIVVVVVSVFCFSNKKIYLSIINKKKLKKIKNIFINSKNIKLKLWRQRRR
jgi:hypothetical protein